MENLKIGDSIAVNGACLTVVKISGSAFTADIMPETVKLTNLRNLKSGDKVNLERTLKLSDGLAEIVTVKTPPQLLKYIIKKGSIAIDGISLTVTEVTGSGFSVSLIPHTAKETTLGFKKPGDEVNLETDIIGKYVDHLLNFKTSAGAETSA